MSHFTKVDASGAPFKPAPPPIVAVVDERTKLMWSVANIGGKRMTFAEAKAACAALTLGGFTDWRLPTVEELFLLADRSRHSPAIDVDAFPDCESDWYWSSLPYVKNPAVYAWGVNFYHGSSGWDGHDGNGFVRAVRSAATATTVRGE